MAQLNKVAWGAIFVALTALVGGCERTGPCGPYGESFWDGSSGSAQIQVWVRRIPSAPVLRQVAAHELGHAMGLLQPQGGDIHDAHSRIATALMYPIVTNNLQLTAADMAAYRAAHSSPSERWQVLIDPACPSTLIEATLDGVAIWHSSVGAKLEARIQACEPSDHVICVRSDDER